MEALTHNISYADLMHRGRSRVIATGVIHSPAGVTLVDPGPTSCLGRLRDALTDSGIEIRDVRTVLITHIHLDHAGATGTLIKENPEITVYVHDRGARHLVDPSKLLASATRLYGDDMDTLWGPFLPVPEKNVRAISGGERISASERNFDVAYTPGHASHHVSYLDRSSGVAFVGDVAGVRTGHGLFVLPPTPPPDIDFELWKESVETVRQWHASTLFLTHYGPHEDPEDHLDALLVHMDALKQTSKECLESGGSDADQQQRFLDQIRVYLARHIPNDETNLYNTAAPLDQCWLGLVRYWRKRGVTAL